MAFFLCSYLFFEPFLVGKVKKENHIRKVRKSEEKNIIYQKGGESLGLINFLGKLVKSSVF